MGRMSAITAEIESNYQQQSAALSWTLPAPSINLPPITLPSKRNALRYGIYPALLASAVYFGRAPAASAYDAVFSSSTNSVSVIKMNDLSKTKFDKDLVLDEHKSLKKLAKKSDLSLTETEEAMEKAYGMKAMTAEEIFTRRNNLKEFVEPARDSAVSLLRQDLDFGKLTAIYRTPSSGYGWRWDPIKKRKGEWVKKFHDGYDIHIGAGQPITSSKELKWVDSHVTSEGINTVTVMDGKDKLDIMHFSPAAGQSFEAGQILPAGTILGIADASGPRMTGPHAHIKRQVFRNGGWVSEDPTKAAQQFVNGVAYSAKFRAVPKVLAAQLMNADGYDFDDIPNQIDEMRVKKKIGPKTAKSVKKLHASYAAKVDKWTDSLVMDGVKRDLAALEVTFSKSDDELVSSKVINISDANGEAVAGYGQLEHEKTLNEARGEYTDDAPTEATEAEVETSVAEPVLSAKWGARIERADEQDLRQRILDNPRTKRYAAQASMTPQELIDDLMDLSIGHEKSGLDPDVKYGDYGKIKGVESDAVGLWQFTGQTQRGIGKQYKLERFPDQKNLATDHGIDIQVDYALANWHYNLGIAKDRDQKFLQETGRPLYNTTYVRNDGKPVYLTYRNGATGSWCGAGSYNNNLEAAQKKAAKDDVPYAKFNMRVKSQNFTDYANIGKTSEHRIQEEAALENINSDPRLMKYYLNKEAPKPAKITMPKIDDTEMMESFRENINTSRAVDSIHYVSDTTSNAALRYEYKPN